MRAEVLAIGTELLLGQIVDTNSAWIGEQLAMAGIDCLYQAKVGDNEDRIVEAILAAAARSDAVICCGGLGPTQDDLTRGCLAKVLSSPLVEDDAMVERIVAMFDSRGRRMPMNNLLQAQRPGNAEFIPQMPGTAPGLMATLDVDGRAVRLYAVPGVPWEMQEMVAGTVIPDLMERSGGRSVIASRTLKTWGTSESALAESLAGRIQDLDSHGQLTLAFLASGIEGLKVRITAKAESDEAAAALLAEEEDRVRAILGETVFGVDDETMESVVLNALAAHGWSLATAESLTGGLISARICGVAGASAVFRGGVVSYAPEVKFSVLDVPEGPVVTEDAARAMARGACAVIDADVALAVTGVAGPDSLEGLPPGTVCMAVVGPFGEMAQTVRLPGRRQQVREYACISVLEMLRRAIASAD